MFHNIRTKTLILFTITCLVSCTTVPSKEHPPLQVVSNVDVAKYLGRWYEVARYPNWFQENYYSVTADYELAIDGSINVINRCKEGGLDGKLKKAVGTAKIVDEQTNAKLKVLFYWPFYGNYWIIALGDDYEYAVVSEPKRQYLWIMSRSPIMKRLQYEKLIKFLAAKYFDTTLLNITPQVKI